MKAKKSKAAKPMAKSVYKKGGSTKARARQAAIAINMKKKGKKPKKKY